MKFAFDLRKLSFLSAALLLLLCWVPAAAAAEEETPRAVVEENTHEFGVVYEGKDVFHTFTIRNQGEAVLEIEDVRTGWGCASVSYARQIPPGGEGNIRLKVNTRGYGGRELSKKAIVFTNDPANREIRFAIKGEVRRFVTISPRRVYLNGAVGEEISQTVTITPHTEKPFRIMTAQAMLDKNISYELNETEKDGRPAYELTVFNEYGEPGRYRDRIVLLTNMSDRPPMSITVVGHLVAKQAATED